MRREAATQKLEELLTRVAAGGFYPSHVDEIHVFGSYAAGALNPADIDLDVEYQSSEELRRLWSRDFFSHRDTNVDFRRAICGSGRGFQVQFNKAEELRGEGGFELVPIYLRGDTLQAATERLRGIREDPSAGSAPREGVFAEIEGLERSIIRPDRMSLDAAVKLGVVSVERVELPSGPPASALTTRRIDDTWGEQNPKRRAAYAAAAWLEANGASDLLAGLPSRPPLHERDYARRAYFGMGSVGDALGALTAGASLCLCVFNETRRTAPLEAIALRPLQSSAEIERAIRES